MGKEVVEEEEEEKRLISLKTKRVKRDKQK